MLLAELTRAGSRDISRRHVDRDTGGPLREPVGAREGRVVVGLKVLMVPSDEPWVRRHLKNGTHDIAVVNGQTAVHRACC